MSEIISLNPAPIAPERQTADRVALYDALLSLKTRDELDAFLNDLCTPAEMRAFAERWADVPNVVLTPHTAGATGEAGQGMLMLLVRNLAAAVAGEPLITPVARAS